MEHSLPVFAFVNFFFSLLLSTVICSILLWKRQPYSALAVAIIISEIYLFANIAVLRDPGIFTFSLMVLLGPALVFRRRTMILIMSVLGIGLYMLSLLIPAFQTHGMTTQLIGISGVVVGAVGIFMVVGQLFRSRLYDSAVVALEREAEAAARARAEEHATQAEELAESRTRNEIAGRLHDSLGHSLTKLSLISEAAARDLDRNPTRALESLQTIQALAREASTALRQSVTTLHTDSIQSQPFIKATQKLVTEAELAGLRTEFIPLGEPRLLPPQVNSVVYSAIKESLTNVYKHAQASQVTLTLDYRCPTSIRLVVHDDGCGAPDLMEGYGLGFMRERVTQMGGTLDISTESEQGLTLSMEVPT